MAYTKSTFNCVRQSASPSASSANNDRHLYTSGDPLSTILTPGYFPSNFDLDGSTPYINDLLDIIGMDGIANTVITDPSTGTVSAYMPAITGDVSVNSITLLDTSSPPGANQLSFYAETVPLTLNVTGAVVTTIPAVASRIGKMVMLNIIGFDFTVASADTIKIDLPAWIAAPIGQTVFPTQTTPGFNVVGSLFTPILLQATIGIDSNTQITIFDLANSEAPFNIGDGIDIEDFTLSYNIA